MVVSIDVDTYLKNDPQRTGELVEALGQGSPFEDEHGYTLIPSHQAYRRSPTAGETD